MENTTFTHEVKFLSQVPNEGDPGKGIMPFVEEKAITKTATFKELSRTDPTQIEMCWMISDVFDLDKSKKKKAGLVVPVDREIAIELAKKFVAEMLITDDSFTLQDKKELECDNGAMIKLGRWLCNNKFLSFFLILMSD